MTTRSVSVVPAERIPTLDALRGLALLGIFCVNMPVFVGSVLGSPNGAHLWPMWWDQAANGFRAIFMSGKFNGMFSMLFAVGFTIQLGRLLERNADNAYWIYVRRLLWLLVFGLIHRVVWYGDVLHNYAVLGLVMLLVLHRLSDRTLIGLIVVSLLVPTIVGLAYWALVTPADIAQLSVWKKEMVAADNAMLGHGSFLDAARRNIQTFLHEQLTNPNLSIGYYTTTIQFSGTMLLGLLLGRRRFFQRTEELLPLVCRVQWWALGVGLFMGALYAAWAVIAANPSVPTVDKALAKFCFVVSRFGVMIFYIAVIVRAMHDTTWRRRLQPLVDAGRMPLTNYLMQTLIATSVFFGWGLGLWGQVGPALQLVFVFSVFFLIQVPFSRWWLGRYQTGPMEYLWRVLTYGRGALKQEKVGPVTAS